MMEAGTLDVGQLLDIEHLIIDEFQDFNPMDLRLADALCVQGVTLFVAGDDDQSLYSTRRPRRPTSPRPSARAQRIRLFQSASPTATRALPAPTLRRGTRSSSISTRDASRRARAERVRQRRAAIKPQTTSRSLSDRVETFTPNEKRCIRSGCVHICELGPCYLNSSWV